MESVTVCLLIPTLKMLDMMKWHVAFGKALHYKLFFLKALTKRLWKLTIKTKRLSQIKSLSFLNFNDYRLTINKPFLTKIGGNNEF
jgi:hypothetical protein